jgi:hypothetical protein
MAEIFGQEGTVFLCYSTSSTTLRSVQQRGMEQDTAFYSEQTDGFT